ncbi:type II toxin-antitoxin system ParD family antitoxin [Aliirhizobium smilacinae]|uniref:Type II toxin-antitoxin system ParD family antitoxin n=1 Tax=Aliirhizobium smilacinae TaxID=1395944 RepID=A0A5C4XAB5_9HYPH|nr:type II toxin-antitoxin system ParD family antitoxin [Rhizobium smilacinae]TNM59660.1 type II toxin-antitoxin system ParD family antitoxin [Rhizobium smilacinae]
MSEGLKITVTLEPEIEDFVRSEVERGSFGSPSDYVEDLIRERREHDIARRQLDAELQKGIDDIEAGRYLPLDEAFTEVRARLGLTPKAR